MSDLGAIHERLLRDFPAGEVKTADRLRFLLASGRYRLTMFADSMLALEVGYAFVYRPPAIRIHWLDYFAIEPGVRDRGYGARAFQLLCDMSASEVGLMLEVQPPTSADPQILNEQRRRIAFYSRLGARQLNIPYLFPHKDGANHMLLMFWPAPGTTQLSRRLLRRIIRNVYADIHGDVPGRDGILNSFIVDVTDQSW